MELVISLESIKLPRRGEWIGCLLVAFAAGGVGWVFFQHPVPCFILANAAWLYPTAARKRKHERAQSLFGKQWRDALFSISASLACGRSLENALHEAYAELTHSYGFEKTPFMSAFQKCCQCLKRGESMEVALNHLQIATPDPALHVFVEVVKICRKSSGNLQDVIRQTTVQLCEQDETEREISVILAKRRLEARLLSVIPVTMLTLLVIASADYMQPLYTEVFGRLVMITAFFIFAASAWWMNRMANALW